MFEFCFWTMLITFSNNLLVPCILRFVCKVWKPGNVSCYIAGSGTGVSCGLTGTDLTICVARIRSRYKGTTTLGSIVFYGGGRCDWLLDVKAATTSFHAAVDLVVLDSSISVEDENQSSENLEEMIFKLHWVESQYDRFYCSIITTWFEDR